MAEGIGDVALDRVTRLATALLGTPSAWIARREADGLALISVRGVVDSSRPRALAICADVIARGATLTERGPIAWAGCPLVVGGALFGAIGVMDPRAHAWSGEEVRVLEDLVAVVVAELELRESLRATREQRAIVEALIESIGDGVLSVDRDRTVLAYNRAARAMFGSPAEVGRRLPDDWGAQHRTLREDGGPLAAEDGAIARGLRGLVTERLTCSVARAGDAPRWIEVNGHPVRGEGGEVTATIAVYRDVTAQKRETDLYKALAGNIPRGAAVLFDRELRCVAADGELLRMNGTTTSSVVGRTMRELAGADAGPGYDAVDALYRQTLAGTGGALDFPNGGRVLALHTTPVRDANGAITGGLVLAIDRTREHEVALALARSEQIHRAIVARIPNGVVLVTDRDLRYVAADGPIMGEVLRRAQIDDLVGKTIADVSAPEHRAENEEIYRRTLAGESLRLELRRGERSFELNTVPIFAGDAISHAMIFVYDVTDRQREADALRQTRDLLGATLANIPDGVVVLDGERRLVLANRAYSSMWGIEPERATGIAKADFFAHVATLVAEPAAFLDRLEHVRDGDRDFELLRPYRRILRRTWTPMDAGSAGASLVIWQDVTAEHDLLAERERLSLVDALTGIPNRRAAERALTVELERARRSGTPLAVAMFDVDHFKKVNDVHGHAVGDDVLRAVGAVLAAQARLTDAVARWGGEEFIAVLPGSLDGARTFAERARAAIAALAGPGLPRVTISAGVAAVVVSEGAGDALERADANLYEAKRTGRDRVVWR